MALSADVFKKKLLVVSVTVYPERFPNDFHIFGSHWGSVGFVFRHKLGLHHIHQHLSPGGSFITHT